MCSVYCYGLIFLFAKCHLWNLCTVIILSSQNWNKWYPGKNKIIITSENVSHTLVVLPSLDWSTASAPCKETVGRCEDHICIVLYYLYLDADWALNLKEMLESNEVFWTWTQSPQSPRPDLLYGSRKPEHTVIWQGMKIIKVTWNWQPGSGICRWLCHVSPTGDEVSSFFCACCREENILSNVHCVENSSCLIGHAVTLWWA